MNARRASAALFLMLVGALCIAGFRAPTNNWDLLGYLGAAVALDTRDSSAIHARVYEMAREHVPPAAFSALTDGAQDAAERSYRRDLYANPDHFVQQLPYYQVRPAYIALIYLLLHAGVDPVGAVHLLSITSYAGIALLMFGWLVRHLAAPFAALAALLLALSPPMVAVLRLASPDALSALMLLAAFFLFLETGRAGAASAMFVAAIAVRSDNILLAVMFLAMLSLVRPWNMSLRKLALAGIAACSAYLLISVSAGHYGWATLFYHSFVSFVPDPATRAVSFDPAQYLLALARGARTPLEGSAVLFAFIGAAAYALPAREDTDTMLDRVLLLLAANAALRYALFPAIWDRFFVAHYMLAGVILVIKGARHVPALHTPNMAILREAK